MFRYIIILAFVLTLSGCGGTATPVSQTPLSIPPGNIYFFTATCPHCANVKEYIETNNIKNRIYFVSRDISSDKDAYAIIQLIGQRCGISQNQLAVPLFWDTEKCYLGDDRVIEYFKTLPQ